MGAQDDATVAHKRGCHVEREEQRRWEEGISISERGVSKRERAQTWHFESDGATMKTISGVCAESIM